MSSWRSTASVLLPKNINVKEDFLVLSERDRAVVAEMCRTGMTLDVLKRSFPQFDPVDVETIYHELNNDQAEDSFNVKISCNCS